MSSWAGPRCAPRPARSHCAHGSLLSPGFLLAGLGWAQPRTGCRVLLCCSLGVRAWWPRGGREQRWQTKPFTLQHRELPVAFIACFVDVFSAVESVVPAAAVPVVSGCCISVHLFVQMPHDTAHSWAAGSRPAKRHEPSRLAKAASRLELHLPLHKLVTAIMTSAFPGAAGACELTQCDLGWAEAW